MTLFPGNPTEQFNPLITGFSTVFEEVGVTGGTAPYTYLATYLSGSTEILAGDTTTNFVSFYASGDGTGPINTKEALWRFTVTDAALDSVSEDCVIRFNFGVEPP
jgi:hypothetical protein